MSKLVIFYILHKLRAVQALRLTYSVLFIVPTQIYKERVDVNKITRSKLKVVKGMMNKTELDYAAMGILF
jgi:hypothetical protein